MTVRTHHLCQHVDDHAQNDCNRTAEFQHLGVWLCHGHNEDRYVTRPDQDASAIEWERIDRERSHTLKIAFGDTDAADREVARLTLAHPGEVFKRYLCRYIPSGAPPHWHVGKDHAERRSYL
jgi:hypothetical protein